MTSDQQPLLVTADGPVVRIRLNTPERGNVLSGRMLDDLLAVLNAADDDPAVRVLVLSGAGRDFCTGGDREELTALLDEDPSGTSLRAVAVKGRRVCDALASTGLVTIAQLHGSVIGAGLALAVFCDLRVGAEDCRFWLPEIQGGIPPAWGGALPRLIHEVGAARVREMVLVADKFDAATAYELSILHKVVPSERLDEAVARWAEPLADRPPAALRTAKLMLNSYALAPRLADGTLFDPDLLASAMTVQARKH
ncbi:enoyl-CoA hydratase/isomerase family protein [Streptomyces sp. NPDC090025]|uniref:enoyl-CoA hydratase/isomerase family protein n=1 Tax=Streptomyces sp. NPDC090025 TaxID=3365922 RepID=UPI0038340F88